MVAPHTPVASTSSPLPSTSTSGSPFASPHHSNKMARHAERLHASFSLRQQAAVDAANREREAWLAWRREVKARREARGVSDEGASGGKQAKGKGKGKGQGKEVGKKDRKTRRLKAEEKVASKARKDRREGVEREVKTAGPKAEVSRAPFALDQPSAPPAAAPPSQSTASDVNASGPIPHTTGRTTASTRTPPKTASTTSGLTTSTANVSTADAPRHAGNAVDATTPTLPGTDSLVALEPPLDDGAEWTDYYSEDDQDPAWLSDDDEPDFASDSAEDEDEFEDLTLSDGDDDPSWFFSVPTLAKMASSIRTHLRQNRKQLEVDGPGWGIRLVGGGGMMLV